MILHHHLLLIWAIGVLKAFQVDFSCILQHFNILRHQIMCFLPRNFVKTPKVHMLAKSLEIVASKQCAHEKWSSGCFLSDRIILSLFNLILRCFRRRFVDTIGVFENGNVKKRLYGRKTPIWTWNMHWMLKWTSETLKGHPEAPRTNLFHVHNSYNGF